MLRSFHSAPRHSAAGARSTAVVCRAFASCVMNARNPTSAANGRGRAVIEGYRVLQKKQDFEQTLSLRDEHTPPVMSYVGAIMKQSRKIAVAMAACVVLMIIWMDFVAEPKYTAHMVVAPYSDTPNDRPISGAGIMALLASGTSSVGGANFGIYIQARNSTPVAERLMRDPDVKEHFFPGQWDSARQQWLQPLSLILGIKSFLGYTAWSPPNASDLTAILNDRIKSNQELQKGIYTFTFTDRDPVFAASLLQRIHNYTEERLRDQALQRTSLQIEHLLGELQQNTISENKQVLTQILLQQQQQRSRINPAIPFSALVVDPPSADRKPSSPRPLLYIFLSLLIPALAGIALSVLPLANPKLAKSFAAMTGVAGSRRRRSSAVTDDL